MEKKELEQLRVYIMFNIIKLSLNFLVGYEKQDNYFQLVLLNLLEWIKGIKITNLLEKLSLIGG